MRINTILASTLSLAVFCTSASCAAENAIRPSIVHKQAGSLDAFKDGKGDATAAIQALIDNTHAGDEIDIPDGRYLINPDISILLHSGTHLVLSKGTVLLAAPSAKTKYAIIKAENISNASVTGGAIIGERDAHIGTEGQWGMGIAILGSSNITISNIEVSKCWGDGIYIAATHKLGVNTESNNVVVKNVTSSYNRRQGLSVVGGRNIQILDSSFTYTTGNSPQSGIDLEPNRGDVADNITIKNSIASYNGGYGIVASRHSSNIRIDHCVLNDNKRNGIFLFGASMVNVDNNIIKDSGGYDIYVNKWSTQYDLKNNSVTAPTFTDQLIHKDRIYIQTH